MRLLGGLVFIGFGIFVALATWLQSLLEPQGVSEGAAGGLLVGMVLAGMIGIAVIPQAVERRHAEAPVPARRVVAGRRRPGALASPPLAAARAAGASCVMGCRAPAGACR